MKEKKTYQPIFNRGIMKKIKLYIDFDGVILDTIKITYQMIEDKNLQTQEEIINFFKSINWKELLKISPIINDSINCIKKIIESEKFDVTILTHVNSDHEKEEKIKFIKKEIPNIKIIACPKRINKCDFVNPINAILIDDYIGNLEKWQAKGGISIKFSDKNKENPNFITITKLDQILDIDFRTKTKIKKQCT